MSQPPIPDTQKAWIQVSRGTPQKALKLTTDWPVSKTLDVGEVFVKVEAAALNPVGYKMLALLPDVLARRPTIAESDFTGIVIDSKDDRYGVGDAVFGYVNIKQQISTKQGALAEYIRVRGDWIVKRPTNVSPIEASGIALAAMTAFKAVDTAKLEEGQSILIHGGSTAVGSFAIQLAKARGATVTAVASGKNEQYVRGLGADEFIDYTRVGPLYQHLANNPPATKYNVILEAVGISDPSLYTYSKPYLAPNGAYVSVGPQPRCDLQSVWHLAKWAAILVLPSKITTGFKPALSFLSVDQNREYFSQLYEYLEDGRVKPVVDSVYEFEDALQAFERLQTRRATGKVVVKVAV